MRIAVAVSGGVDSLVAARLLQQDGHDLFGIHFLTGFEPDGGTRIAVIRRMTDGIGMALEVVDLSDAFRETVAAYFVETYREGRTPNPCMVCNPRIKLEHLWQAARACGAEALATGHYAIVRQVPGGGFGLFKGADPGKDQSYFLARATARQLARTLFPLGGWHKSRVKALARNEGLKPASTDESQDVCFIQDASVADFLARHGGLTGRPGPIRDLSGRVVGTHPGLHHFTIGQRRGINVPAAAPYYVVGMDTSENCLLVGGKSDLTATRCRVMDINWIAPAPREPITATVKVRYRSPEIPAVVTPMGPDCADVRFQSPVAAVTPGQGAVFYANDRVLGGGWIAPAVSV